MQPYGQSSWLKDSKPIKELKAVHSTIKTLLSWRVAIDNESYTILVKALWYHRSYSEDHWRIRPSKMLVAGPREELCSIHALRGASERILGSEALI